MSPLLSLVSRLGKRLPRRTARNKRRAVRLRYETLKRNLAKLDWLDMNDYARAKTDVVEPIIASALQEVVNVAS